ncbi:carbon-nitrogen hydrolase family protein [Jannaschia sp. R86511]|uniref:carbon-nitrogen hydrolase family protein n=1 Tax=Jannaschia sp. R86511 TaxID=3093853 RepID=UPI0036D3782F
MEPTLTVAAAQPPVVGADLPQTVRAHAEVVRAARSRLVVFPELSLTGYELDAPAVAVEDPVLQPLLDACRETRTVALVGAPVGPPGATSIAVVRVDQAGARVAYRKTWLDGREAARFVPGDGPAVTEVDGWRVGLGVCKDTGAAQHTVGTAALGVDVYAAGVVHHPEELAEQEARAVVIARTCDAYVVLAGFAGATGGGYARTAGSSGVWSPTGAALARAGTEPGGVATCTLTRIPPA